MKKIVVALLLVTLSLTGCGENFGKKETLIIGIDEEFAPISFHNEKNELVGFDIDLAKEACKRLGVEAEFKPIVWDNKREEISSGNVDIIWNGLDITDERKEYMIFSKPYMEDRQTFLVKRGNKQDIHTEGDLAGKIIGVQAGSTSESYLNDDVHLKSLFKDFKTYHRLNDGISDLKNSAIDVFICDELIARYEMIQEPKEFETINVSTGYITETAIGFSKDNTELRDRIQKVFDEMIRDGTAKAISEKWFGADLIRHR